MTHWVMIEMAKLSKEKRDRINRLLKQDLCIDCEHGIPSARGNCQACLGKLYSIKKYSDPIKAAKYESGKLRNGRLLPIYDKSFTLAKRAARSAS